MKTSASGCTSVIIFQQGRFVVMNYFKNSEDKSYFTLSPLELAKEFEVEQRNKRKTFQRKINQTEEAIERKFALPRVGWIDNMLRINHYNQWVKGDFN